MSPKPLLYLDTMIFLDLLRQRGGYESSVALLEKIRSRVYKAMTSTLAILEIHSNEQEEVYWRRQIIDNRKTVDEVRRSRISLNKADLANLRDKMDKEVWEGIVRSRAVEVYTPDKEIWDDAQRLMSELAISPPDAIHVASAIQQECDLFVTKDQNLLEILEDFIDVSKPDQVDTRLKELGWE